MNWNCWNILCRAPLAVIYSDFYLAMTGAYSDLVCGLGSIWRSGRRRKWNLWQKKKRSLNWNCWNIPSSAPLAVIYSDFYLAMTGAYSDLVCGLGTDLKKWWKKKRSLNGNCWNILSRAPLAVICSDFYLAMTGAYSDPVCYSLLHLLKHTSYSVDQNRILGQLSLACRCVPLVLQIVQNRCKTISINNHQYVCTQTAVKADRGYRKYQTF